jgi:probable aminopeptidase NPEPL1
VRVACVCDDDGAIDAEWLTVLSEETRLAARLVDMPTNELTTDAFVDLARETAAKLGTEVMVIEGESLAHAGFGGLWGVGKAATNPPALVVLDYQPQNPAKDAKTVAWVGKGIVYDTGGLSIKPKNGMPGMKTDMGGAAAVLAGFRAAVRLGASHRIIAILCIAENSVGPDAVRNDDILSMYSGRTVEINNTDAEGRLVLADGVAYAVRHYAPDVLIDLATLTGAQLVATGKRHAGIVCNDDALEAHAVVIGRRVGELVHPLPYCPEFFRAEFKSVVADMKNSVKDRMNAQSSCAAQFVAEHLGDYENPWLHIDLAGPSREGERATGYGPTLLVSLLEAL